MVEDFRSALDSFRKCLAIREELTASDPTNTRDRYFAAICYGHIGYAFWKIGDAKGDADSYRQALESHRKYVETMEAVSAADSSNAEYKRVLVYAIDNFATSQLKAGDAAGALTSYKRVLVMFGKLMADDPANIEARRFLAEINSNMSDALAKIGRTAEALAYGRKALAIYESLHNSDPTDAENRARLMRVREKIGGLSSKSVNAAEAAASATN